MYQAAAFTCGCSLWCSMSAAVRKASYVKILVRQRMQLTSGHAVAHADDARSVAV